MPDSAISAAASQGWIYDLLRWSGVDQPTAAHVQQVLVKPVSLVLVVAGAFVLAWAGTRLIRRWVSAAARRAGQRSESPRAERRAATLTAMTVNIWRVLVGVVTFFVALGIVGVNLTPLLAGATIVGATIGFGAQSVVRDFLSGFLLTVEGQFDIGDTIRVGDTSGVVEDLTLRVTRLRAADGAVWYVPNGEIRTLGNTVRGWGRATVDLAVPPSTGVDHLLSAMSGAAEAVHADPSYGRACLEAPVLWGLVDAGVDSITARVTVRTRFEDRERVERAVREEALRRLGTPDDASPVSS